MKKINNRIIVGIAAGLIAFAIAPLAFALTVPSPSGFTTTPSGVITSPSDITGLFCGVITWIFWLLIILAVVMFLIGGYTYATSSGESEKVSQATKTLTYAAVAVVVALVAFGVPTLVQSFLNGGTGSITACGAATNNGGIGTPGNAG